MWTGLGLSLVALLIAVVIHDLQRKHAILHNFPIVGHFRYWLESVGPELRQYIVTSNTEERPFSRDQRRWVYASAKLANNYFGFGSDHDMELTPNYLIIKHQVFPRRTPRTGDPDFDGSFVIPGAKVLGGFRQRARAFTPPSVINISGMSFGCVGGVLPRGKISPEIARIRGIPTDRDCVSAGCHSAFHDVDSLLDFAEAIAAETGLPVGIKSAVGELAFWRELARLMSRGDRGVDFVTIDGSEGGTGAGPLVFADHVSLPFKVGFSRVQHVFAEYALDDQLVFIGSGKLGFPDAALLAFTLGCDLISVGREALLSIGCIQALRCHTNHCPTGIATQHPWLIRGLDPALKSARLANYVVSLRKELLILTHACGADHPSLVSVEQLEILDDRFGSKTVAEIFGGRGLGLPSNDQARTPSPIAANMRSAAAPSFR